MLSGGELIIVAMAVVALAAMACSAILGILARLTRGDITPRRSPFRRRRSADRN